MFLHCSLRALCPSSPPPRGLKAAPVRPPQGAPHFDVFLDMVDILLIFH